jgi:hypothetical protein
MPKKSREQKIKASRRLYESLLHSAPRQEYSRPTVSNPEKTASAVKMILQETEKEKIITRYFISDFKKSMLLIVCVIALELFFYFASMSTNFSWLFKF